MCGLFGYYSSRIGLEKKAIESTLAALHHRGPESRKYWATNDGCVVLGHTRLSIIDLNNVAQPLSSETNDVKLIVNGEFYDYQRIRKNLINQGHQFTTHTDSEIALHLYEEKGIHCLEDLRGEFAFIIWDERNHTLIAARDRFGVKPLYYSINDNGLYIASEINALFAAGVKCEWDKQGFFHYNHFNFDQDRTLYNNIFQVPPGHYLVANTNGYKIVQYWDLNYPDSNQIKNELTVNECIEITRAALLESVRLRLVADVPVGCYLSGGIDSASLLGIASNISQNNRLSAFSICFNESEVDEGTIAERTAAHNGAKFNPLILSQDDLADNFEAAVTQAMTPLPNAAGVARFLLSKHARDNGFKVVLSGEGADEIFFGYNYMRFEAFPEQQQTQTKNLGHRIPIDRSSHNELPKDFVSVKSTLGYVPKWLETQAYFNAANRSLFSKDYLDKFMHYNPYRALLNNLNVGTQLFGKERLMQSTYLWFKTVFPNTMLNCIGDRMEMAHSIEARAPFLDHYLYEAVKYMPTNYKITPETEKYILREAVKPFVTDEVYKRQKFMFQAPSIKFDGKNKFYTMLTDLINAHIKNVNIYDFSKVKKFLDYTTTLNNAEMVKTFSASVTLMLLASMAVLQKNFKPALP